jgi:hypothetical protein
VLDDEDLDFVAAKTQAVLESFHHVYDDAVLDFDAAKFPAVLESSQHPR